jgi:hypothetical protein
MTEQQIAANKQRFIDLCNEHIHREGLDKVLAYLEKSDFYTAPSSTRFHLNEDGGLCLHSMNVFEAACKIYNEMAKPAIVNGTSPFTEEVSMESIAIATLFHDLCKIKLYHKTERWKKDDKNRWVSYPGYEVKDDFPLGHGEKSCLMLSWYMRLKPEEMLAIRWHMGMFDMGESGTPLRMSFFSATDKSPLVSIVHAADFLTSNLWEKTTVY